MSIASPPSITIGLVTDTHYWPDSDVQFGSEQSQLQPWSGQLQAALMADLAAADLDYLFHLGDVSCGGGVFGMDADEVERVIADTLADFDSLPTSFHALPGNHDAPLGQPWTFFEQQVSLARGLGRTIDLPQARLILLNTQGHSDAQITAALPNDPIVGWVSDGELARLDQELAAAADRPVILFMHQLLQRWTHSQPFLHYYWVENADAVLELMARHGNVRVVVQGHAHAYDVQACSVAGNPCHFIIVPAMIEYPIGWLHLTLGHNTIDLSLRRLPLPDLRRLSREAGTGQAWRGGRPEWQTMRIAY
jgi:3',5'-cyclic AMP phosphodiesterase CpdA